MITNKNMTNEELVDKLMDKIIDLVTSEDYIRTRDYVRINDVKEEILNRMDVVEEINIDVVILV
jgi:hypothetical protein